METVPDRGFPHFTTSNGGNSDAFNEGPGAFLGLPNPFNITNTTVWTVRYYVCMCVSTTKLINFPHLPIHTGKDTVLH